VATDFIVLEKFQQRYEDLGDVAVVRELFTKEKLPIIVVLIEENLVGYICVQIAKLKKLNHRTSELRKFIFCRKSRNGLYSFLIPMLCVGMLQDMKLR